MRHQGMKIGELAKATGLTSKTIRYYELQGLIEEPERAESGYRYFGPEDIERLEFIKKAKRLGLSLGETKEVLSIHKQRQAPCVHVIALLDRKLEEVDSVIRGLKEFRKELTRLREESQVRLDHLPAESRVCGIIEQGIHSKGEAALVWLEGHRMRG
jgi:DNA-binding transcriptional MerR regulator